MVKRRSGPNKGHYRRSPKFENGFRLARQPSAPFSRSQMVTVRVRGNRYFGRPTGDCLEEQNRRNMADVVESTRFEVELQDSAGLISKQAGSPYIRDRKAIDGSSKPRMSTVPGFLGRATPSTRVPLTGGSVVSPRSPPRFRCVQRSDASKPSCGMNDKRR
ncbi:hypothetical protein HPB49_022868 [Dermacentor silvarum]|uniref:Uncharacterized protein n=1 Tax=Dermacentor silvarum TaxID=543639 RepID=A0ACB8DQQ9_DERSI|nr:hypothetical protein HPB49_022868 [Dermacentor silvarum]